VIFSLTAIFRSDARKKMIPWIILGIILTALIVAILAVILTRMCCPGGDRPGSGRISPRD